MRQAAPRVCRAGAGRSYVKCLRPTAVVLEPRVRHRSNAYSEAMTGHGIPAPRPWNSAASASPGINASDSGARRAVASSHPATGGPGRSLPSYRPVLAWVTGCCP
jgi:hypothetical protein